MRFIHPKLTEKRVISAMKAEMTTLKNPGLCTGCGNRQEGCESDAVDYECSRCGKGLVCGAAWLMNMGWYHKSEPVVELVKYCTRCGEPMVGSHENRSCTGLL